MCKCMVLYTTHDSYILTIFVCFHVLFHLFNIIGLPLDKNMFALMPLEIIDLHPKRDFFLSSFSYGLTTRFVNVCLTKNIAKDKLVLILNKLNSHYAE